MASTKNKPIDWRGVGDLSLGDLLYFLNGDWVKLPIGLPGSFLRSQGASLAPSWNVEIPNVFVNHDGWTASVTIPGSLSSSSSSTDIDAGTYDASNLELTVTSNGYSDVGTTTTRVRIIESVRTSRLPKDDSNDPTVDDVVDNGNGTITVKVGLSDYIYAGDTVTYLLKSGFSSNIPSNVNGTSANFSTESAPVPVAQWAVAGYETVDSDFDVDIVAFGRHAQDQEPVVGVRFTAVDESLNSVNIDVSTQTLAADNVPVYRGTIPVASLNDNEKITVSATVYPHIGTATKVSIPEIFDDLPNDTSKKFTHLTYMNNKSGGFGGPTYAYVDPGATPSTGVTSTTAGTAAANPYLNIKDALNGVRTFNGSNFSRTNRANSFVRLVTGPHTYGNSADASSPREPSWCVIEKDPVGGTASIVPENAQINIRTSKIKLKDITIDWGTVSSVGEAIMLQGSSSGVTGDLEDRFMIESCIYIGPTGTWNFPLVYKYRRLYFVDSSFADEAYQIVFGQFSTNTTNVSLVRNCTTDNTSVTSGSSIGKSCETKAILGSTLDMNRVAMADETIVGYCKLYDVRDGAGSTVALSNSNKEIDAGIAIVSTLAERGTESAAAALILINGDGVIQPSQNILVYNSVFVGNRTNIAYNEGSAPSNPIHKLWRFAGTYNEEWNQKNDNTFVGANVNSINNWGVVNGVGFNNNANDQVSAFELELAGYDHSFTTKAVAFVSDGSVDYPAVTLGTGNGDYRIKLGSGLDGVIPTSKQTIKWLLDGLPNDGSVGCMGSGPSSSSSSSSSSSIPSGPPLFGNATIDAFSDKLCAAWKLEEASGVRSDETGNFPLSDNSVGNAAGIDGNGASFTNIIQSLEAATAVVSTPGNAVVSIWFNLSSAGSTTIIVSEHGASSQGIQIDTNTFGNIFVRVKDTTLFGLTLSDSPVVYPLNNWHNVIVTIDSGTAYSYINGAFVTSASMTGALVLGDKLRIGTSGGVSSTFTGVVDEVNVWCGLSFGGPNPTRAAFVTAIYNGGIGNHVL